MGLTQKHEYRFNTTETNRYMDIITWLFHEYYIKLMSYYMDI
jgi:hypothetical protein